MCIRDRYYTDVRNKPNGEDHLNIRNFIKTGFKGIRFEQEALALK